MFRSLIPFVLIAPALLSAGPATPAAASAFVVEETSMKRVSAEARPGTWVVFDIDNTLITPVGHLGSDEWYDWLVERGVSEGLTREVASARADDAFNRWQGRVAMRAVDPATPGVLADLRARGIPFFALTARSPGARDATLRQLASLGLGMDAATPAIDTTAAVARLGAGSAYASGVFFIGEGGLTKGEALSRILDAATGQPAALVFVDDKAKHTVTVDASLTARKLPHLCLRFSRKDPEVRAFREDMANWRELTTGVGEGPSR